MLLEIKNVLDAARLERVTELLGKAEFVDGMLSAGADARRVKNNEEVAAQYAGLAELNEIVMGALHSHPTFQAAVLPHRVSVPFFARYTKGMAYGDHIDDPVMGEATRYRCDVAMTVFLSAPENYAGGELVVRSEFGDREIKLPAGNAVIYPAASLHRVNTVTSGQRLVAVAWAQSLVREPARRELLFELHLARESLRATLPDAEVTAKVNTSYVNLVRMWSEV